MQLELFDQSFGKMSLAHSVPIGEKISGQFLMPWQNWGSWKLNGQSWMRAGMEFPNDEGACSSSLSSILLPADQVEAKYFLSEQASLGILRRAEKRGKQIPEPLLTALTTVANQTTMP